MGENREELKGGVEISNKEIVYYQMLENVHVDGGFNFWRSEIYTREEFWETGIEGLFENLLKEGKCKLFESKDKKM